MKIEYQIESYNDFVSQFPSILANMKQSGKSKIRLTFFADKDIQTQIKQYLQTTNPTPRIIYPPTFEACRRCLEVEFTL
jgi:hypothetical protein